MRLFAALPVPEGARARLGEAQELLRREMPGAEVRWVDPEQSHLTLRFLGEIADRDLAGCRLTVAEAARRSRPFRLATAGFGAFPTPRRPSVLWLGVSGDLAELDRLQGMVSAGLEHLAGGSGSESFRPHLTLGRVKRLDAASRESFSRLLAAEPPAAAVSWRVESVELVASRLGPGGARYSVVQSSPLGGPALG